MKLSKKEELIALGSALYLMGIEIEGSRSKLQALADQQEGEEGISATSELLEGIRAFENAQREFARLEKRFLKLKEELQAT